MLEISEVEENESPVIVSHSMNLAQTDGLRQKLPPYKQSPHRWQARRIVVKNLLDCSQ